MAAITLVVATTLASEAATVTIEGMQFSPVTMTVRRGNTVVWVNKDLVPHTATAPRSFDSRVIEPNQRFEYVAGAPGRYEYICTLHPTMKGTLIVE